VDALDALALDLEHNDRVLRVAEHEVDLAVDRALDVVPHHPAHRVERLPLVRETLAERASAWFRELSSHAASGRPLASGHVP
jgi:hypothetical protein